MPRDGYQGVGLPPVPGMGKRAPGGDSGRSGASHRLAVALEAVAAGEAPGPIPRADIAAVVGNNPRLVKSIESLLNSG